jgi:hypothetical protein
MQLENKESSLIIYQGYVVRDSFYDAFVVFLDSDILLATLAGLAKWRPFSCMLRRKTYQMHNKLTNLT